MAILLWCAEGRFRVARKVVVEVWPLFRAIKDVWYRVPGQIRRSLFYSSEASNQVSGRYERRRRRS